MPIIGRPIIGQNDIGTPLVISRCFCFQLRHRIESRQVMFGCLDTWLLWQLTGKRVFASEYSCASSTVLFDPYQVCVLISILISFVTCYVCLMVSNKHGHVRIIALLNRVGSDLRTNRCLTYVDGRWAVQYGLFFLTTFCHFSNVHGNWSLSARRRQAWLNQVCQ